MVQINQSNLNDGKQSIYAIRSWIN